MSKRARRVSRASIVLVSCAIAVAAIARTAPTDNVEQVKQVMGKMLEAAKAGQDEKVADFFLPEDAKLVKRLVAAAKNAETKTKAVAALLKDKLGKELPKQAKQPDADSLTSDLAKRSLDDLTFKSVNGTVVAIDKTGSKTTFVKHEGTWKAKFDPFERKMLDAVVDVFEGTVKMLDAVEAGVNDGTITKDNFDQKSEEIGKVHLGAPAAKLGKLMMELIAKAMGEAMSRPASRPAATRPPATAPEAPVVARPAATRPPATAPATAPLTDLDRAVDEAVRRALRPVTRPATGKAPPAHLIDKLAEEKLAKAWDDFLHYVRIGHVKAANSFGRALLTSGADPKQIYLLSTETEDTHAVLARAAGNPELKEVAVAVRRIIQDGYEKMRKDPVEIRKSIDMLVKSPRAYEIGKRQLVRSGAYSLPQIVQKLTDPKVNPLLRERLIIVLPAMGKEAVLPLSIALQTKDPHLQEIFAEALGRIQYPHAGPRLREFIERKGLLKPVRRAAVTALVSCAGEPALKKSVAEMYYDMAVKYYYHRGSLRPDERWPNANVWRWRDEALVYKPVPRQIFCDIYAMRLSRLALEHDPKFYPAVSLWLAAYINKEVHLAQLGQGATDPTRGQDQPPARFYALAASARFQQDVLARGLRDFNTPVVLTIMEALVRTNGAKNMVKVHGGAQPLVEALAYPDRHVRFMAAEALAAALPDERFNGDDAVMSVLIEALRQTGEKKAMIVVKDQTTLNSLKDAVRAAGYQVMENADPVKAIARVSEAGGVDVFVVDRSPGPEQLLLLLRRKGRFITTPVVAAVTATEPRRELAGRDKRLILIGAEPTSEQVGKALQAAAKLAAGKPMTPEQADQWTIRATKAVRLLALTGNSVLDYKRARGPLIAALKLKTKPKIQVVAADALAVMREADAQRAIADLANDKATSQDVRIASYNSLIASVRKHGNQLTEAQSQAVVKEVLGKGPQPIRQAAAQTLSPLDLTSEKIKQLILSTEGMD